MVGPPEIAGLSLLGGAVTASISALADAQPSGTVATALIGAAVTALGGLFALMRRLDQRAADARAETTAAHAQTIDRLTREVEELRAQNDELRDQVLDWATRAARVRRGSDGFNEF